MTKPTYLGDGVYIREAPQGLELYLFDGLDESSVIVLEFETALSLFDYLKRFIEEV